MGIDLTNTLPTIIGLPFSTFLLSLALASMLVPIITSIIVQIGGALDLLQSIDVI
jgi:hypothetical protein